MEKIVTLRISPDMEKALDAEAKARGVKRSVVVREALKAHLRIGVGTPYERVKHIIDGIEGMRGEDLGFIAGEKVEMFQPRAKRAQRGRAR